MTFDHWYDANLDRLLKDNHRDAMHEAYKAGQDLPKDRDWLLERIRFLEQQMAENNA